MKNSQEMFVNTITPKENQKSKIITVEDTKVYREQWVEQLKELGFEIIEVDGVEAWEAIRESIPYEDIAGAILDYSVIGGNTLNIAEYLNGKGIYFIGASADEAYNRELVGKGALLMSTKEHAVDDLLRVINGPTSEIEKIRSKILADISSVNEKKHQRELHIADRENAIEAGYDQEPILEIDIPDGAYKVTCASLYQLCECSSVAWHVPLAGKIEVKDQEFVILDDGTEFKITGSRTGLNGSCKAISVWLRRYTRDSKEYCLAALYLDTPTSEESRSSMEEEISSKYELWSSRGVKNPIPLTNIVTIKNRYY
ncbi:hypothetical protein LDC_0848 [sediment metagenome]|uniref:Response regulatory domain-containing protein n=1 Tax=sediment metagenome TaxID=749907 RepID=D9PH49_9ZZZZ